MRLSGYRQLMELAFDLTQTRDVRRFLCQMTAASEDMPFGPDALVYKILEKRMFALLMWNRDPLALNLKCDPNQALILREQYAAIAPGYHMNKQHWNTVTLDASLPDALVISMIHNSYTLVVNQLSKKDQKLLGYPTAAMGNPYGREVNSI
ncbi:MAG: MmcQ/YjbR family DNA-binding protein [Gammaproteobacteria bacterium]|nr:MmcQ/YjbR family DNA-binding protein [Gammaproteobacteria bacterium]